MQEPSNNNQLAKNHPKLNRLKVNYVFSRGYAKNPIVVNEMSIGQNKKGC